MGEALGTIGGIVGLVVFLGAVVVYLRGSKDKGTITTLEASNRALTERVDLLEEAEQRYIAAAKATATQHEADISALKTRVRALEDENDHLLALRPSAEAIDALTGQLAKHDSDIKALLRARKVST